MSQALYEQLKTHIQELDDEYEKFHSKGNKTACTRCRKHLMAIHKLSKQIRKQLMVEKTALPKRKR